MNSKLKVTLIAAIAALSIGSPVLAQAAIQNGLVNTQQENSSDAFTPSYVPGYGNINVGPSGE
jgi:hypothetical protein